MFTAKGRDVSFLHFRISWRSPSGSGQMSAVMMPKPPALDTALASSAYPTCYRGAATLAPARHRNGMLPSASPNLLAYHPARRALWVARGTACQPDMSLLSAATDLRAGQPTPTSDPEPASQLRVEGHVAGDRRESSRWGDGDGMVEGEAGMSWQRHGSLDAKNRTDGARNTGADPDLDTSRAMWFAKGNKSLAMRLSYGPGGQPSRLASAFVR